MIESQPISCAAEECDLDRPGGAVLINDEIVFPASDLPDDADTLADVFEPVHFFMKKDQFVNVRVVFNHPVKRFGDEKIDLCSQELFP